MGWQFRVFVEFVDNHANQHPAATGWSGARKQTFHRFTVVLSRGRSPLRKRSAIVGDFQNRNPQRRAEFGASAFNRLVATRRVAVRQSKARSARGRRCDQDGAAGRERKIDRFSEQSMASRANELLSGQISGVGRARHHGGCSWGGDDRSAHRCAHAAAVAGIARCAATGFIGRSAGVASTPAAAHSATHAAAAERYARQSR